MTPQGKSDNTDHMGQIHQTCAGHARASHTKQIQIEIEQRSLITHSIVRHDTCIYHHRSSDCAILTKHRGIAGNHEKHKQQHTVRTTIPTPSRSITNIIARPKHQNVTWISSSFNATNTRPQQLRAARTASSTYSPAQC